MNDYGVKKCKISVHKLAFACFVLIFFTGCANMRVAPEGLYPLRAQFVGTIAEQNQVNPISGALYIMSGTQAKAQIDGPGGLAAFIISLEENRIRIVDTWGRPVKSLDIPVQDFLAVLAGAPPRSRYYFKRRQGQYTQLSYIWGTVKLDKHRRAKEVVLKSDPALKIELQPQNEDVRLLATYADVRLDISMKILEGGRWRHD